MRGPYLNEYSTQPVTQHTTGRMSARFSKQPTPNVSPTWLWPFHDKTRLAGAKRACQTGLAGHIDCARTEMRRLNHHVRRSRCLRVDHDSSHFEQSDGKPLPLFLMTTYRPMPSGTSPDCLRRWARINTRSLLCVPQYEVLVCVHCSLIGLCCGGLHSPSEDTGIYGKRSWQINVWAPQFVCRWGTLCAGPILDVKKKIVRYVRWMPRSGQRRFTTFGMMRPSDQPGRRPVAFGPCVAMTKHRSILCRWRVVSARLTKLAPASKSEWCR